MNILPEEKTEFNSEFDESSVDESLDERMKFLTNEFVLCIAHLIM